MALQPAESGAKPARLRRVFDVGHDRTNLATIVRIATSRSGCAAVALAIILVCPVARAQFVEEGLGVKVHVQREKTVVKNYQDVLLNTEITNTGTQPTTLLLAPCSYSDEWVSQQEGVKIRRDVCEKPLADVVLKPGETFSQPLSLHISLAPGPVRTYPPPELDQTTISFRLGFVPKINPPALNLDRAIIWSNAVTLKVSDLARGRDE